MYKLQKSEILDLPVPSVSDNINLILWTLVRSNYFQAEQFEGNLMRLAFIVHQPINKVLKVQPSSATTKGINSIYTHNIYEHINFTNSFKGFFASTTFTGYFYNRILQQNVGPFCIS